MYATYNAIESIVKNDGYDNFYSVPNPIYGEKNKRIKSFDECATDGESREFLKLFDEKDYAMIVPYTPEYAFGSRVEPVTKNIHDYYASIVEKTENKFKHQITKELLDRKNEVSNIQVDCKARDIFFNFTYVPVYVNVFKYKNKIYKLYISGVNGKVEGKTPVSIWYRIRQVLRVVGIGALLAIIIKLFTK